MERGLSGQASRLPTGGIGGAAAVLIAASAAVGQPAQPEPPPGPPPAEAQAKPAPPDSKPEHPPSYDLWHEIEAPTSTPVELDDIYTPHTGVLPFSFLDAPFDAIFRKSQALEEATGLRLGFAYTMVFL